MLFMVLFLAVKLLVCRKLADTANMNISAVDKNLWYIKVSMTELSA